MRLQSSVMYAWTVKPDYQLEGWCLLPGDDLQEFIKVIKNPYLVYAYIPNVSTSINDLPNKTFVIEYL